MEVEVVLVAVANVCSVGNDGEGAPCVPGGDFEVLEYLEGEALVRIAVDLDAPAGLGRLLLRKQLLL
jgi:hypothetical protein